jgi:hypothetical protein
VAIAGMCGAAAPAQPIAGEDFRELIVAAVAAGASTAQAGTRTICVQREFESPLKLSKDGMDNFHMKPGMPGVPVAEPTAPAAAGRRAIEQAFAVAISPKAAIASRTAIGKVPKPYIGYSSAASMPHKCEIPPIPGPGSPPVRNDVTRLILSRPVFANGFAFIDQRSECMGFCGSGWLRVFQKRNGRWKQVLCRNLFVS